ncbi:hypothetical protein FRC12_024639 [Ceratobasidium sp. 428]|nr:hypothetical protein FRC12_024639 [Ceratobasidium sp. 428]
MEATSQTQKLLTSSAPVPASESDDFPEDKFLAIDIDSIECQEVELSYMAMEKVRVTCTTGLLNGVRVLRKSYNSPDRIITSQLAKRDLASLSKYIHPNYASLKGVARDTHGQIREIVVTTGEQDVRKTLQLICFFIAPMSQQGFLERVRDPVAIARYMKGMSELHMLEHASNRGSWWKVGSEVQIQANCNGHVTAIPVEGKSSWNWFNPRDTKPSPAAKYILEIFYDQVGGVGDPQNSPGLHRFIDGVSHLQPGFTSLDVLKLAVDATATPSLSLCHFITYEPPSTTFSAGDFVIIENRRLVRVLEKGSRQVIPIYFQHTFPPRLADSSYADGWYSLSTSPSFLGGWREAIEPEPWKVFRTEAKQISQSHDIALHRLSQVIRLIVMVCFEPIYSESDAPGASSFHRRPASTECPREFWGFFSASKDPYEQCPKLPPGKRRVSTLAVRDMSRDYSYRYETMVNDGLKTMPGSFND